MKFTNMNEIRSATTEDLEARLAELKSTKVAEPKELSKDEIDEQVFKARADELMNVDPEAAMKWLQKAEDMKIKRETKLDELAKAKLKFTPGTSEYIDYLAKGIDRLANEVKYDVTLDDEGKRKRFAQIENVKDEMRKYPMGLVLLGEQKEITGKQFTKTLDDFLEVNPVVIDEKTKVYSNVSDLTPKLEAWVTEQGGDALISAKLVKQLNDRAEASKKGPEELTKVKEAELGLAKGAQELAKGTYDLLDKKYPDLREKDVKLATKLAGFIKSGDSGNITSRNNAVKSMSRLGSDEALSETDFGRAVGRDLAGMAKDKVSRFITDQNLPISDDEWNKLKNAAIEPIKELVKRYDRADKEFPKLLDNISDVRSVAGGIAGFKFDSKPKAKTEKKVLDGVIFQ